LPPFGAWFENDATRFRARSANATRLEVSLFAEAVGGDAKVTVALTRTPGSDVWEGTASSSAHMPSYPECR
jgi:hypothetical protein